MTDRSALSPAATVAVGVATGLFASWVKVLVEAPMQAFAETMWPPAPGQKDLVGADPGGQPEKMPPAVLAKAVWKRVHGDELDDAQALKIQFYVHYTFGAAFGAGYALVARRLPLASRLIGAPAGAALYAGTHGTLLPVLGVQPPPIKLPRAAVVRPRRGLFRRRAR